MSLKIEFEKSMFFSALRLTEKEIFSTVFTRIPSSVLTAVFPPPLYF